MNTCLITGGAGFIGSHLVEEMLKIGWNVKVLDNLASGDLNNFKKVQKDVDFIDMDVRNLPKLKKLKLKADLIIHLAALVSVNKSILNPKKTFDINLNGTINILEIAREQGINKIILASSSAVYGNINKENIKESDPTIPISPYGLSKLMAEEALALYSRLYGLTTTSLRFFNVFGPRQNGNSPYSGVISRFLERLQKGKNPVIYGNGKQTRDFVYVEDVVSAIIKAGTREDGKNHIYNVGTGKTVSINDLLSILIKIMPQKEKKSVFYNPKREGDIMYSGADINKIKKELKFMSRFDIEKGLKRLV